MRSSGTHPVALFAWLLCAQGFNLFDVNRDGYISPGEMFKCASAFDQHVLFLLISFALGSVCCRYLSTYLRVWMSLGLGDDAARNMPAEDRQRFIVHVRILRLLFLPLLVADG